MRGKPTVTVGIPAYNEESNIRQLLESVFLQRAANFTLVRVIVFSDASTDGTADIVRGFPDSRVMLIDSKKRSGQAEGQNAILRHSDTDLVVLLNADVLLIGQDAMERMVAPFLSDHRLGLVSVGSRPVESRTWFESLVNYSVRYKTDMFERWNGGHNLMTCVGRARVFSRQLAQQLRWPASSSEDAYSYLACVSVGLGYAYVPERLILFKSPDNFTDHMKQSTRFMSGPGKMEKYFPPDLVRENYAIPAGIKIRSSIRHFLANPPYFMAFVCLLVLSNIRSRVRREDTNLWSMAGSSKKLT